MNRLPAAQPLLRDATPADFPAIAAIYAHHVLNGAASFEETPPDLDELLNRHAAVRERELPWIVAELDGKVCGYSYATPYRPRAAYRYSVEDSIYIEETCRGLGLGRLLLESLIARCEAGPWRQMIAVIGDPRGGSLALHRSLGFELAGTLHGIGYKHGQWRDTLLMQRPLGPGSAAAPAV